jgi:predicted transcriptional regulator
MQKLKRSRRQQFERLDRPALKPLPLIPFPYAEWKTAKVNVDYHIELDGHYYSVPYQLAQHAAGGPLQRPHRGMLP